MGNKLIKSGFIYTIGIVLVQGLAFITLPVYTRMMSQVSFGQFSLYMSWVSIISIIIGFQTNGSLSVAKLKFEDRFDEYSAHALSVSNLFFISIFIISVFFINNLSVLLGFSKQVTVILLFQSYFHFIVNFFSQYFIQYQKTIASLILSFFTSVMSVILSIILLNILDNDFLSRMIGLVIPYSLATIFCIIVIYKNGKSLINKNYLYFTISVSFPLIFHSLGNQILNQLDRVMIGKFLTVKDVALYSFGYSLGLIIQVVLMSLNTVWVPWFFESRKNKLSNLKLVIQVYLKIGLFLTIAYLTVSSEVINLMGGIEYSASIYFTPMIILSYFFVFLYTFPVNVQFYYANTKYIPIGTIIAAVVNFLLNFLLIPVMGIYGSAIATVISYLILLVLHHFISKIKYNYDDVSVKSYLTLSTIAIIYTLFVTKFANEIFIRYITGIILLIYFYLSNKNTINNFLINRRRK
ncbi:lipopolysaccharide biosynthesis protein [Streptococcus uberis]|uniref:lipopolysaccharide biosynthesis protein n=1 Tax=Streptococcus uberis TaxID=1349 RepID=UPI0012B5C081|nr:oligosaccharide flippase family protein [Streptococcus uberis]MTB34732.1 oligosaccharide flippase family protein [Streptococcus uberis]MTB37455.1 oligosaccharide flippase family protein [Streptococcus uberis]MTB55529.1 oligosaccharide flippase family protein [Streptococcus uberis]MTB60022.1 oligosaccharide flippase family protein [Streptococcus uberis]MTB77550.1 oligosaccharide flippase family protein [Streptococcus uberis]